MSAAVGGGFVRATKQRARLRMALVGPSGSGKTYTALAIAKHLAGDGAIAVIDTERGSSDKYADVFTFDSLKLTSFDPRDYIEAIQAATAAGYRVLIIDSLSHAWFGKNGALELVDRVTKKNGRGNSFESWRHVTPLHNAMVNAILDASMHVIVTLRVKTAYVVEQDDRGKMSPQKIGLAPVQREGLEYEFDVVADVNLDHDLIVSKTRCSALAGQVFPCAGKTVAGLLSRWLGEGAPAPAEAPTPVPAPASASTGEGPRPLPSGSEDSGAYPLPSAPPVVHRDLKPANVSVDLDAPIDLSKMSPLEQGAVARWEAQFETAASKGELNSVRSGSAYAVGASAGPEYRRWRDVQVARAEARLAKAAALAKTQGASPAGKAVAS